MISKKRLAANRRNALKSTGPRTEAGKRICSMNALKHGLCSKRRFLLDDSGAVGWFAEGSADAFERLRGELIRELRPVGPGENAWLERIAGCAWKLRRARALEAAATDVGFYGGDPRRATHCPQRQIKDCHESIGELAMLSRYLEELFNAQRKALREFQRVQSVRRAKEAQKVKIPERTHFLPQVQAASGSVAI